MNTTIYDNVEGSFDIHKVQERIASEAELIGSYTIEQNTQLKDFMGYLHKEFTADNRVVTLLTPEELSVYFRGLEILANHTMESVVITKPANSTAAGRKKMVEEVVASGQATDWLGGQSLSDLLDAKEGT